MPNLDGNYLEYAGSIGYELGYGRSPDGWSGEQPGNVADLLRSAQRSVYYPEIVAANGRTETHNWSFLTILTTLTLESGGTTVMLPPDFQEVVGRIVNLSDNKLSPPIDLSAETRVNTHRFPTTTGYPRMAEIEWLDGTGQGFGQRKRLAIWPTADQAYTLQFYYKVNPDALATTRPFAYGGPPHAETFKAACLAACEFYVDGQRGTRYDYFQRRLAASVSMDRNLKPGVIGYMGDGSDGYGNGWRWNESRVWWDGPRVTYNGGQIS